MRHGGGGGDGGGGGGGGGLPEDAGLDRVVEAMRAMEARSMEKSSPFGPAQLGEERWRRQQAMAAAVRREGAASMRECSVFLLATFAYAEFVQLSSLGKTGQALRALYDALFADEKAVLYMSDGPCSKVCLLRA